jgi:SpoVK/Ycf46/Vps4 family AAA+-type ATPase
VIVIGATNRPDAVDPALRRPGRFDREFYFPLPNKDARKRIIGINTRKWDPRLSDDMLDRLATLTKGYGGADLRVSRSICRMDPSGTLLMIQALCTEAALNAIQRRYPQIYRSTDRYELNAKSIQVQAKDFMMSIKSTSVRRCIGASS